MAKSKPELVVFIFIPLPRDVAKTIKKLQRELSYPPLIDDPHLTIYYCRFTKQAYKKLLNQLSKLDFQNFILNLTKLGYQKSKNGGNFYYIKIRNTNLQKLHGKIISIVNPLRGDLQRSNELKRIKKGQYNKKDLQYLYKYGFVDVMDRYNPHITITDQVVLDQKTLSALKAKIKTLPRLWKAETFKVQLLKYDDKYTKIAESEFKFSN